MTKIEKKNMRITVISISGRKIPLDVDPEETIKSLKKEITSIEGIWFDKMALLFHGKRAEDEDTIESLGIEEGDIIHLIITDLRGG